ncbi:MAG: 50S ribosomal protein L25 [Firmicutes bacterium]|nr:50S ribosomal protein L25 [Bacillota bacterium]
MTEVNLQVNYRQQTGKSYRKELARKDMVPGVVYGKAVGSIPVEMEFKTLKTVLAGGRNAVIDLALQGPGEAESRNFKVLIKDLHVDPIKRVIQNIDFYQISMDNAIQVAVPIELTGELESGILQYGLRELQVSCLPGDIPREVAVSLEGMNVGDCVSVQDIKVPDSVTVLDDPGSVVASVVAQRVEEPGPAEDTVEEGAESETTGDVNS